MDFFGDNCTFVILALTFLSNQMTEKNMHLHHCQPIIRCMLSSFPKYFTCHEVVKKEHVNIKGDGENT